MTDNNTQQPIDEKYVVLATKVSRHAAEQLAQIAKKKGMTIYELMQMVVDTWTQLLSERSLGLRNETPSNSIIERI